MAAGAATEAGSLSGALERLGEGVQSLRSRETLRDLVAAVREHDLLMLDAEPTGIHP